MLTWFQRRHIHPGTAVLGALLVVSVLGLGVLHYAPAVHAKIHHDAHDEDHHCVVEIFADGILADVVTVQVAFAAEVIATEHTVAREICLDKTKHLRPLGRAPPIV